MRILVIEDDGRLARQITRELQRANHNASACNDGAEGLQAALRDPPDLIVLDVNLPGMDGLAVLAALREAHSTARILILTALGSVTDRVKGLKAGADDYLPKPFSMNELMARIDALGRRASTPTAVDLLKVADLQMDVQHRHVTRGGRQIALSPREFDVLQVLMQEPGRVFSRTELCERIWQREHEYDTRTVEIFIARLRKKIDANFASPLIQTLRYVGYTIRDPAGLQKVTPN
jgi:two-component system OmpR family response regulator